MIINIKTVTFVILLFVSVITYGQNWQTDLEASKQLAAAENKTIILVFQGSDWCAPCMKLEKGIWETEEFISYSQKHYVMLKADFPRKKKNQVDDEQVKKNKELAAKYNTKGYFPFVVILNKNGTVLGETGYKKMTPEEYIKHLDSFIE